jgi:hypothetical protein
MIAPETTTLRLHLRRNGFDPIPVEGKAPHMNGWQQKFGVSEDEIRLWPKTWHLAENTGVLAKFAPGLDSDIMIEPAAKAVEMLAREHFEEHGEIRVRFGKPPKRLIPLRTDEPFTKLFRVFTAPDGSEQKIEILGDGQQFVVSGEHPDTHKPYGWHGGDLATIKRESLPYVRRGDVERFLDAAVKLLTEEFDFVLKNESTGGGQQKTNGDAREAGEHPEADPKLIAAALAVIPNNVNWDGWNNIAMATWRATGGSAEGFAAFDAWSKKSPKYNAHTTAEKWAVLFKSPPTQIGAGTVFYLADQAAPGWRQEYEARKANPQPDPAPQPQPGPPTTVLLFHRHGEKDPLEDRAWLVEGLIPEVGAGLISGQWGMLKTFIALELAQCMMTPRPFINRFDIVRPGGVLLIALEGQNEVAIRFQGVLEKKGKGKYLEGAPFYWCDECPPLTDPKTSDVIIATAKAVAAEFKQRFDLPLVLILVDSLIAGAGYRKEGQDNDAVVTNAILQNMAKVSRAIGCFSFVIDHFGKDIDVGTRGSSVKEVAADVIFACLGGRKDGGEVINSRLALRKLRSGASGEECPFRGKPVEVGINLKTGKMETTLVIEWGDAGKYTAPKKDDWGRSRGVKQLRRIIMDLLADCGEQVKPFADGPMLRALKLKLVENEFFRSYATVGETEADKKDARRKALKRALDQAGDKIVTRDIGGVDYIWLSQKGPGESSGATAELGPAEDA